MALMVLSSRRKASYQEHSCWSALYVSVVEAKWCSLPCVPDTLLAAVGLLGRTLQQEPSGKRLADGEF